MTTDLPSSWAEATLDQVSQINPPGAATAVPDHEPVTFVPMAAVEELSGRMRTDTIKPFGEVKKGFTRFRDGDVLFAKITPCMENGKIAVARGLRGGVGCGSTEFHVLRPHEAADAEYLRYFLVRSAYRRDAQRNMQGAVGQQRVPTDYLRESVIPLPPKAEQQRIVSRIEEVFSEIDEGERALERVGQLVERYRQSVLKAAVTGELTQSAPVGTGAEERLAALLEARRAVWRANAGSGRYPEPSELSGQHDLPSLPQGWAWACIDQVGLVSGGLTKNRDRAERELRRPYLRVANVYANRLNLDEVQEIGVSEAELPRVTLKPADLLVVEGNGSVDQIGRVALWDGSIPGCVHQNHIIKVRCTDLLPSWYVLVWCLSPLGRAHIERVASSSSGLHTLSISKIQSLPIPVPPLEALKRIKDEFDRMDAAMVSVRASLAEESARASALRQSILKAAFSGQLVPQDPRDEPASALLARLAAQAAAVPAEPKRRGRKPAQPAPA
jgi:type I restriction enzyme S subunit